MLCRDFVLPTPAYRLLLDVLAQMLQQIQDGNFDR
jgi:hypothetical protein